MLLLEALIMAHQQYGARGSWTVCHAGDALRISKRPMHSGVYFGYGATGGLLTHTTSLEATIAGMAEAEPAAVLDGTWKIG